MSASFRFTTNSTVYFVRFGTFGKLVSHDAGAADGALWAVANFEPEAPKSPSETPAPAAFFKNARLCIPLLIIRAMRCHHSFESILKYVAIFHDELYPLQLGNVCERITRDRDQIRELARLNGADAVLPSHQQRRL
jgi:hypothetical protein